jgi:diaminopimelate epimerase
MMLQFHKYQGTGNDFVMLDNRDKRYSKLTQKQVAAICDRRFGIGADGLILLELASGVDFTMVYFNSDGRESSMCGNGGRCIARFANDLKVPGRHYTFNAIDGLHEAEIFDDTIRLKMQDVKQVEELGTAAFYTNTGSPHFVQFVSGVMEQDLLTQAKAIRYSDTYKEAGVNVNLVEVLGDTTLEMRTYERGVEDETFSCGTGVTAAVLAAHAANRIKNQKVSVKTKGGELSLSFDLSETGYTNIWLEGPAKAVFSGSIEIE